VTSTRVFLDFAIEAAWQAGRLALGHFQTGIAAERKADLSPVTAADRGAEELLRKLIADRFPDHAVLGEELGTADRDSAYRWILDPIDGTRSFVRGVPLWGVLVGLEISGEMVVGVANFPALGELVAAASGEGCRSNGRPARVSPVSRLEEALVVFSDPRAVAERLPHAWPRFLGMTELQRGWSDCYAHCLVATGRAEIALDPIMSAWDCAALLPILREAGGTFSDFTGRATIEGGNALSTNGRLLETALEILRLDVPKPPAA
jgi:histidinol-phosphatase